MSAIARELLERPADELAAELVRSASAEWIAALARALDRRGARSDLARVLDVWGLSQSEAAEAFGVTRQAVAKWCARDVPRTRVEAVADLAAATDLLVRYLRPDRIPAVVRRPAARLGGQSLLELVGAGDTRGVLAATRAMFDFHRTSA